MTIITIILSYIMSIWASFDTLTWNMLSKTLRFYTWPRSSSQQELPMQFYQVKLTWIFATGLCADLICLQLLGRSSNFWPDEICYLKHFLLLANVRNEDFLGGQIELNFAFWPVSKRLWPKNCLGLIYTVWFFPVLTR